MSGLTIPVDTLIISPESNQTSELDSRSDVLKAVYKQLFKENRDLEFFHNAALESAYLQGQFNTRELVRRLLCSEMYRDYILSVNSNYHFVGLCFERVLGRPASKSEVMTWSSFLATQGLDAFAEALTNSEEYMTVFGDNGVPARRSAKISSSNQGIPALPEEQSQKRYGIPTYSYLPPDSIRKLGAVVVVAGAIEVVRIIVMLAASALNTGL
ncbi:MAG: phycobilisome Linker polypeptide [Spirulina sp. SIO3F2]|nr:phycobilisome Linker polypeptide [Spirulina sp. SIO3F2]